MASSTNSSTPCGRRTRPSSSRSSPTAPRPEVAGPDIPHRSTTRMTTPPNPLLSRSFARLEHDPPAEQPRVANTLEPTANGPPSGPSPAVSGDIRQATDDSLRLYPDPASNRLREAIARRHGLEPAMVFVGNGSDEIL